MIAPMAKKQARNERSGEVTKEGFAEFIGEMVMVITPFDANEIEKHREAWNKANNIMVVQEKPKSTLSPQVVQQSNAILANAKRSIDKNPAYAKKRLREIIDKYPDTDAAKEAAKLLK